MGASLLQYGPSQRAVHPRSRWGSEMRRATLLLTTTIAFGVVYLVATAALGSPPDAGDSAATVAAWFRDNDGNVRTWLWLLTISAPLFALYAALVRAVLP